MLVFEGTGEHRNHIALQPDPAYTSESGWGFFTEEISWFLHDFFCERLDAEQKLIFYSYYILGMTLEEISDRLYSNIQMKSFKHKDEHKADDKIIKDSKRFNISHQAVDKKLNTINDRLKHSWQYSDRW